MWGRKKITIGKMRSDTSYNEYQEIRLHKKKSCLQMETFIFLHNIN